MTLNEQKMKEDLEESLSEEGRLQGFYLATKGKEVCLNALNKLEKIEQIVKQVESKHPEIAIGDREGISKIREILESEE